MRALRGKGNYVDDIVLPGMLHGAVLRSPPYAHARLVSIDTTAADAHPKVRAVITGALLETSSLLGYRRCPMTWWRCLPPTRCASKGKRWPSS